MTIYDCRKQPVPQSRRFPCNVRIVDARTGARIPNVFYLDTHPPQVGRFLVGPDGEPLAKATGKRVRGRPEHAARVDWAPSRMAPVATTPDSLPEYERLELFERREWLALSVDTGEVVARSEEPKT